MHTDKAWQEKDSQLFAKEWTRSDKKVEFFFFLLSDGEKKKVHENE